MDRNQYDFLIKAAFKEDLGSKGDITSTAIFKDKEATFILFSKDNGVLAGIQLFKDVFDQLDRKIKVTSYFSDGTQLSPGMWVAQVSGKIVHILCGERVALNFLSTLSGIASRTNQFTQAAGSGGSAKILDTRKTLPGYRYLSKYAVTVGGGTNHRMGLYDMVMIKDNHIDAAGSITQAVALVRRRWGQKFKIEVECRSLKDVEEALTCEIDIIMVDNMDITLINKAVALVRGKVKLEASGNMELTRIREVSQSGVDYISVGMITKSVTAFDFSLKMEKKI